MLQSKSISALLAEARALLKSKLPALQAVPQALMTNKSLNHDQVVELIKSEFDVCELIDPKKLKIVFISLI